MKLKMYKHPYPLTMKDSDGFIIFQILSEHIIKSRGKRIDLRKYDPIRIELIMLKILLYVFMIGFMLGLIKLIIRW